MIAYDPRKQKEREKEGETRTVESWSVSVTDIFNNFGLRLDAWHFNPQAAAAVRHLEESGLQLEHLSDLASVTLRGQFARIWAQDEQHGVRYFNATDMLSLLALGVPSGGLRFLSHATNTDIEALKIRQGWLLMTCSGTLGRIFYVPRRLDGWAATHDLIRIVPNEADMTGYLHAWLGTQLAQAQILTYTHGGQIDHVTDDQVKEILVPLLGGEQRKIIHDVVMKALYAREEAIESLVTAWREI